MSTKITSVELQGASTVDMALPSTDNSSAIPNTAWVQSLLAGFAPGSGTVTLPGGLILKWGTTPSFNTGPQVITLGFPNNCFTVMLTDTLSSGASRIWSVTAFSAASFSAHNDGTGSALWLAVGN